MTQRIEQRGERDCGIAAIAMFLGLSYEEMAKEFPADTPTEGIYLANLKFELRGRGLLIQEWVLRDGEPLPKVKAILETQVRRDSLQGHFVLALPDGTVLDPHPSRPGIQAVSWYDVTRALFVQEE